MPDQDYLCPIPSGGFPRQAPQDFSQRPQNSGYSGLTLLDLPVEILLNIFAWLPHSNEEQERLERCKASHQSITHSLKALRLTSRSLSIFLAPVLFDAIQISNTSSARGFFRWCSERGFRGNRPPVRRLTISNVASPSISKPATHLIPYDIFEDLLVLLTSSLHQLKIEFSDCFTFSEKMALAFRRAKQLSVLHLRITKKARHPNSSPSRTRPTHLHDARPFLKFLGALPNLFELNLGNCLDHCMSLDINDQMTCLPLVRHLVVNFDKQSSLLPNNPHTLLLQLCSAIADSLLILEIKGSRYDPGKLISLLRVTQERLEALHLSDTSLVPECAGLQFPRLRSFRLDDSRYLTPAEFRSPLFERVNTLVLRTWGGTDVPLDVPVETFPNLKRIILTHTPHFTRDILPLFKACNAASVNLLSSSGSIDLIEIWAIDAIDRVNEHHRESRQPETH